MFFTVDLNVRISLKCIYIKFGLFSLCYLQDIMVLFKIASFPFLLHYCDFVSIATEEDYLLKSWSTFSENHKHAVAKLFISLVSNWQP